MLPDERIEAIEHLTSSNRKLLAIIAESESNGICLQTIYRIIGVKEDLQLAAVNLIRCELRSSLQTMVRQDQPNSDEEQKKILEEYQLWLKVI